MVREGGFEPPRLSAPPPQDGVSASSTTPAGENFNFAKSIYGDSKVSRGLQASLGIISIRDLMALELSSFPQALRRARELPHHSESLDLPV